MKTKLLISLSVLSLLFTSSPKTLASQSHDPLPIIADTVVVRPACIVVTAVGAVFFVVSLPFAAMSKSVKKSADTLVVRPAQAAFTRPLGDLDALVD